MIREPYTRYTFTNLVAIPLAALALVAGLRWLVAENPDEVATMAKICLGSLAVLAIAVWLRHSAPRQKIDAHKRVLRLSRQSGVSDELIAGTQGWSDKHLQQLQRKMDEDDSEGACG